MAAIYENSSIRFQYPDNWVLDDSEAAESSVTVYSPGGSFWSLVWRDLAEDPADLAIEALESLKQEYAETESEPVVETLEGHELAGYDVSFYYVDLVNTALIRGFRTRRASCLILCQADDVEFRTIEMVFRAITLSLLQSS